MKKVFFIIVCLGLILASSSFAMTSKSSVKSDETSTTMGAPREDYGYYGFYNRAGNSLSLRVYGDGNNYYAGDHRMIPAQSSFAVYGKKYTFNYYIVIDNIKFWTRFKY